MILITPFFVGTHMVANTSVSLTLPPYTVLVSTDFIEMTGKAPLRGFLAIAYTISDSNPEFVYGIATLGAGELHAEVHISELVEPEYRVSVFIRVAI